MQEHNGPPHVQTPVHVLLIPAQTVLRVKGRPPAALIGMCSLFWIVWAKSCRPYRSANFHCKPVEDY